MDGKQVVFGEAVKGFEVLDKIGGISVGEGNEVRIINCGLLGDKKKFLTHDPLSKQNLAKIREANKFNRLNLEVEESEEEEVV